MSCFPFRTSSRRWTSSWTSGSIYVSYFGLRTPYSFEWCRIGQPSSRRDSLYRISLAIAAGMPCRISTSWCWLDELGAWHSSSALGPPWCEFVASTGGGSTTMNMVDGLERNFWDLFGKSSKSSTSMLPAMWSRMSFQTGMLMRSFNFSFVAWWTSTSSGTRIALFVQLPRSSHEALYVLLYFWLQLQFFVTIGAHCEFFTRYFTTQCTVLSVTLWTLFVVLSTLWFVQCSRFVLSM